MDTKHTCSWCEPGTPGNHGICEKHKAQLLAEYKRDCESEQAARTFCDLERARSYRYPTPVRNDELEARWNGHRMSQMAFSLIVLAGCAIAGLLVGASIATWEALLK